MQELLINVTRLGLVNLVRCFNQYVLGNIGNEAIQLPALDNRFLSIRDRENLLEHVLVNFSERSDPDKTQPLCDRVPNKLLREYKLFVQSILDRKFAHVYEHLQYMTATERLVCFVCEQYNWADVLENDLLGINTDALQLVEKLLDTGTFFKALHNWINNCEKLDLNDDCAISKAFFDFIRHLRQQGK